MINATKLRIIKITKNTVIQIKRVLFVSAGESSGRNKLPLQ